MTMLTGLLPAEHGVNPSDIRDVLLLNPEIMILTEILRQNHYHTAGFAEGGFVHPRYGFHRGFDVYDSDFYRSDSSWTRAKKFIKTHDPDRKFFLFVHTYDVHDYVHELGAGFEGFARPASDLKRAYSKRVSQTDLQLKDFLRVLNERGHGEDTLLILTSDHGEGFDEHNFRTHGNSLYNELLRIPLIMTGPLIPARKRVASPVSLVDIVPTILEWANIEVPKGLKGQSLFSSVYQAPGTHRSHPIFSENALRTQSIFSETEDAFIEEDISPMFSIITGAHKYINFTDRNEELLFDLIADPAEIQNLSEREPEVLGSYRTLAGEFRGSLEAHVPEKKELTEDLEQQLRGLGYIQ